MTEPNLARADDATQAVLSLLARTDLDNDTVSLVARNVLGIVSMRCGTVKAVSEMEIDGETYTVAVLDGAHAAEFLTAEEHEIGKQANVAGHEQTVRIDGGFSMADIESAVVNAKPKSEDDAEMANCTAVAFDALRLIEMRSSDAKEPSVTVMSTITALTAIALAAAIADGEIIGGIDSLEKLIEINGNGVRTLTTTLYGVLKNKREG